MIRHERDEGAVVIGSDAIEDFDGKTISYTYDNGWAFTNTFHANIRHSSVPRGELREEVQIKRLRDGLYFVSWIDDEMGLISQIIDFETNAVLAAVPVEGELRTEVLRADLIAGCIRSAVQERISGCHTRSLEQSG